MSECLGNSRLFDITHFKQEVYVIAKLHRCIENTHDGNFDLSINNSRTDSLVSNQENSASGWEKKGGRLAAEPRDGKAAHT